MTDLRIRYDEAMIGADHPTKGDTLNRLAAIEHNNDGTHNKLTTVTDPYIDVRAYGIDPSNSASANDTGFTALLAALSGGEVVLFSPGTYLHSAEIALTVPVTI